MIDFFLEIYVYLATKSENIHVQFWELKFHWFLNYVVIFGTWQIHEEISHQNSQYAMHIVSWSANPMVEQH